ncbi:ATP-binding protein [Undibacterium sp. Tian12W]|uniref:ATP-binding protein n=1 Tax=Undibacterium sp. Tian12W TaxID=3413054 RepID=UPI003BF17AA7
MMQNNRYSPAKILLAILLTLLILLTGAVIWHVAADTAQSSASSLHLTEAQWQLASEPGMPPPPSIVNSNSLPANWQTVALPLALPVALLRQAKSGTGSNAASSITWLKLSLTGLHEQAAPLALYASRIKTDGSIAVYADGHLIHSAQQQGPLWNSTRTPLWIILGKNSEAPPPKEILIRLEHSAKTQIAMSSVWIGTVESLRGRYNVRQWLQQELPAMLSAAFLAVGIFALFVWLRRRHDIAYLLFFSLAVTSFLRGLHFYVSFPIANNWFAWLTVNSLFWLVITVHFYLRLLHGNPLIWLSRILTSLTALIAVLTLPVLTVLPNTPKVTPLIYVIAAMMGAAVALIGGLNVWRRSRDGQLVAIGVGICTLFGVTDWLLQNNFISPEALYLGSYANAVACTIFGIVMYRRYLNAIVQVELLNASLAQRLQVREAELELSYQRLREIELQQQISDERQRLMQDMHDGLGSSLISAIRSVDRHDISNSKVSQILKDCLDDLKLTIDSLEPVAADLLLLLATLRFRLEPRLEGTGIVLLWEVQELPTLPWLDPSSALHILRIVQESIANILRHSHASEVRLATAVADGGAVDGVEVTVTDNGRGFDVAKALNTVAGRGLHNQQRRARALNGTVSWDSNPAGTRFTLWLPLQRILT